MPTSPKPDFHVPGAYFFDPPPPWTVRGLGTDVFLPPVASSPVESTYLDLTRSVGRLYAENAGKRKRAAHESRESTPLDSGGRAADGGAAYTLAGQIDVAGSAAGVPALDDSVYSDVEYRRTLGPAPRRDASHGDDAESWTVLHALGQVVGKVWEFCTAGAFRGFHAPGGGAGYDWETGRRDDTPAPASAPATVPAEHEPGPEATPAPSRDRTPQRHGKRRQVSLGGDDLGRSWVMVDSRPKPTPHPSMTTTTTTTATPGTTVSRRIHTPVSRRGGAAASHHRRGASAASTARLSPTVRPSSSTREPMSSASFASPRASTPVGSASPRRTAPLSVYSPGGSRIPVPLSGSGADANPFARAAAAAARPSSQAGSRASSRAGSRAGGSVSAPSGKSGRYSSNTAGGGPTTPRARGTRVGLAKTTTTTDGVGMAESPRLTDEARRLAAQNRAADQESDAKMAALNMRLQEMIRQGQEALGTTFEVDDDSGDDSWAGD